MIKTILVVSKTLFLGFVTTITIGSFITLSASAITPYFNVFGGDVSTGSSSFGGSCGTNSNSGILAYNTGANKGASTNLAAIAPSIINGFQSSSGIAPDGGANSTFITGSTPDTLTFANTPASTYGGNYGSNGDCLTDYYSLTSAVPGLTKGTPGAGTVTLTSNPTNPFNNCTIVSGTTYCWENPSSGYLAIQSPMAYSGNLVIFVQGDVAINNNILLNQTYSSVANIPSLYVVASGNINIASTVNTLDGVYVAEPTAVTNVGGYITTCTQQNDVQLSASTLAASCGTVLKVDGSFQAAQVRLNRTGGGDYTVPYTTTTPAAEDFTFEPSTWINNPFGNLTTNPGSPTDFSVSNLPPVL
jgi:hypothetical protein